MASDDTTLGAGGLEEVESSTLSVTIRRDGVAAPEDFSVRVFMAKATGFVQYLRELLEELGQEDPHAAAWLVTFLGLHGRGHELDRRRSRSFSIRSLEHCKPVQDAVKLSGVRAEPAAEQLVRIAGSVSSPRGDLLADALYEQPEIRLGLSAEEYAEVRDELLGDLVRIQGELAEMMDDVVGKARAELAGDRGLSEAERAEALAAFDAVVPQAAEAEFAGIWEEFERDALREVLATEEKTTAPFAGLVEASRRILDAVVGEATARGVEVGEGREDFAAVIRDRLEPGAANKIFWQAIQGYEAAFGLEPVREAELVEVPEDAGEEDGDVRGDDPQAQRHGEYLWLWWAYRSEDVLEKWDALVWIARELASRNECLRLLAREAEDAYHAVLERYFKAIYRRIRGRLTKPERRAFGLLHFRLPAFGYRIAILEPVVTGFFKGMDEESKALVILGILFRVCEWNGVKLSSELERRWRAYLRLYPTWVELARDEERQRRQRNGWRRRARPLETAGQAAPAPSPGGGEASADSMVPGDGGVESWARRYCPPERARCVIRRFVDGWTEEQIAEEEGISQQGVSGRLRRTFEEIRRGLERDGVVSH